MTGQVSSHCSSWGAVSKLRPRSCCHLLGWGQILLVNPVTKRSKRSKSLWLSQLRTIHGLHPESYWASHLSKVCRLYSTRFKHAMQAFLQATIAKIIYIYIYVDVSSDNWNIRRYLGKQWKTYHFLSMKSSTTAKFSGAHRTNQLGSGCGSDRI